MFIITVVAVLGLGTAANALTASDFDSVARELTATGRYLEYSSNGDLDRSIDDANSDGIAFVWLDVDEDAELLAAELADRLDGSPYRTVVVLTNTQIGAWSNTVADASIEQALDDSQGLFGSGAVADGLDRFTASLTGTLTGSDNTTATTTDPSTSSTSSDGGIGFGTILLIALLGGGGFLLFRNLRNKSKARKQAELDLEEDRAEIKEQLRNNADHVLELGDQVIAAGKPGLITTYEQASAAYQEVSGGIDAATTAEEIDRLDDLIDNAEWQFESIEAELEGRPRPPSPAEVEAQAKASARGSTDDGPTPPAPSRDDRPAVGADESVIGGSPQAPSPRQPMPYPRSRSRSGGLGGILGGVLGSIVLGGGGMGGMGGMGSRRTQRRRSQFPSGGGSVGGGLGGGVLRRGGSSSRSTGRRRRGSGGSRSVRRGGGGSRRF